MADRLDEVNHVAIAMVSAALVGPMQEIPPLWRELSERDKERVVAWLVALNVGTVTRLADAQGLTPEQLWQDIAMAYAQDAAGG